MQLSLEPDEAEILREALVQYLSDLRGEIGKTEDYDTRQTLKQRETVLNKIVAGLSQAA